MGVSSVSDNPEGGTKLGRPDTLWNGGHQHGSQRIPENYSSATTPRNPTEAQAQWSLCIKFPIAALTNYRRLCGLS